MVSCTVFAPDFLISLAVIMVTFAGSVRASTASPGRRVQEITTSFTSKTSSLSEEFFRRRNEREAQAHGTNDHTNTYTGKQSTHDTYLSYARRAEETELSVWSPCLQIVVSLHLPV